MNRRFLWQYAKKLDIERMKEGAAYLTGRHDFASFCGLKMKKSTVRNVTGIDIHRSGEDLIVLDYYGDGFLNHMVRLMTGELVEVGAGRLGLRQSDRSLHSVQRVQPAKRRPLRG